MDCTAVTLAAAAAAETGPATSRSWQGPQYLDTEGRGRGPAVQVISLIAACCPSHAVESGDSTAWLGQHPQTACC